MGVEHYLVCGECKQYIDLHKRYFFSALIQRKTPPIDYHKGDGSWGFNNYWDARGVWFLWKHKGHRKIDLWTNANDDWFDLEPNLEEVFKHKDDLKARKNLDITRHSEE